MNNNLRIKRGISRGEPFDIQINGTPVLAHPGETIAAVMLAAGYRMFRTPHSPENRALCFVG